MADWFTPTMGSLSRSSPDDLSDTATAILVRMAGACERGPVKATHAQIGRRFAKCSEAVARREMAHLVTIGAVERLGSATGTPEWMILPEGIRLLDSRRARTGNDTSDTPKLVPETTRAKAPVENDTSGSYQKRQEARTGSDTSLVPETTGAPALLSLDRARSCPSSTSFDLEQQQHDAREAPTSPPPGQTPGSRGAGDGERSGEIQEPTLADCLRAWEKTVGRREIVNPLELGQLVTLVEHHGAPRVYFAIAEAVRYRKVFIAYVEGICKGNGKPKQQQLGVGDGPQGPDAPPSPFTPEEQVIVDRKIGLRRGA